MNTRTFISLTLMLFSSATAVYAGHWPAPPATTTYMHLAGALTIDGAPPQEGDELALFGEQAKPLAVFVVDGANGNFYGDIAVNGDDPLTRNVTEGAKTGEPLTVKVWSKTQNREYAGKEITLHPATDFAPRYQTGTVPLRFTPNAFYSFNIECQ